MCAPRPHQHNTLSTGAYVYRRFNLQPSCVFIQMAGTHTSALLDNPWHKSCSALIYMAACCFCCCNPSLFAVPPQRRSSIPHVLDFCREHLFHWEFRTYTHFSCGELANVRCPFLLCTSLATLDSKSREIATQMFALFPQLPTWFYFCCSLNAAILLVNFNGEKSTTSQL